MKNYFSKSWSITLPSARFSSTFIMFLCMYLCVCVCAHVCMHVRVCLCMCLWKDVEVRGYLRHLSQFTLNFCIFESLSLSEGKIH